MTPGWFPGRKNTFLAKKNCFTPSPLGPSCRIPQNALAKSRDPGPEPSKTRIFRVLGVEKVKIFDRKNLFFYFFLWSKYGPRGVIRPK